MEAGVDQWSALSHQAAPFGRVSHSETTTFTPPLVGSSFHTAYRRPNVGLPEALSMVSIGLSWLLVRTGRPVVRVWNVVPPAAIRLITTLEGIDPLRLSDRPLPPRFPGPSAAPPGARQRDARPAVGGAG